MGVSPSCNVEIAVFSSRMPGAFVRANRKGSFESVVKMTLASAGAGI